MSEGAFRILRPDGRLEKGRTAPSLASKDLLRLYRVMLLNRRVDERMITLQRQGRIGFYVGSIGEEASIIGSAFALENNDWIFPCYRELGAILLRGFTLFELCCQLFGNSQDAIKGRQMPNHYASAKLHYGSVSSPVGTQIPHATGIGLASRLQGRSDLALAYFGDGATSTGDFHAALNFAAVYKAATVFLCRNNQWAISVAPHQQTATASLAVKSTAYGMEGVQVDGNDILGVYEITRQAAHKARSGKGPTLIEAITYRMGAHTTSDDPRAYRDENDVVKWEKKDPIRRFKSYLIREKLWDKEKDELLEEEIKDEIHTAVTQAEQIDLPHIRTMFEDVLDQIPWHLEDQLNETQESSQLDTIEQET